MSCCLVLSGLYFYYRTRSSEVLSFGGSFHEKFKNLPKKIRGPPISILFLISKKKKWEVVYHVVVVVTKWKMNRIFPFISPCFHRGCKRISSRCGFQFSWPVIDFTMLLPPALLCGRPVARDTITIVSNNIAPKHWNRQCRHHLQLYCYAPSASRQPQCFRSN